MNIVFYKIEDWFFTPQYLSSTISVCSLLAFKEKSKSNSVRWNNLKSKNYFQKYHIKMYANDQSLITLICISTFDHNVLILCWWTAYPVCAPWMKSFKLLWRLLRIVTENPGLSCLLPWLLNSGKHLIFQKWHSIVVWPESFESLCLSLVNWCGDKSIY